MRAQIWGSWVAMSVSFCATLCRCCGVSGNQPDQAERKRLDVQKGIFGAIDKCPGALASHRECVTDLRRFGVIPTVWAGGHGTGAAPIKPLVEALEKADKQ